MSNKRLSCFRLRKRRFGFVMLILLCFVGFNVLLLWFRPENTTELFASSASTKKSDIVNSPAMTTTTTFIRELTPSMKLQEVSLDVDYRAEFESQFDIVFSDSSIPTDSKAKYVVIIPRKNTDFITHFNADDKTTAIMAAGILEELKSMDGVACLPRTVRDKKQRQHARLFNETWCNFLRRDWSIQIRNTGKIRQLELRFTNIMRSNNSQYTMFQLCNIINGPFILKKDRFLELKGFQANYGRLTLLDFFLRSNGKLTIGKFVNCFFSNELFYLDRGNLEGSDNFPEYSNFGVNHNVLRIIMEDKIEWTRCVATSKHCKEQPYIPPTTLPKIAQPICCSVLLAEMLRDIVAVFTKLNIDYRLIYGTLLGAERSGAIIPYTSDIDLAVEYKISHNITRYDLLQKYFSDKYYISSKSFMGMPRMIPLIPVYLKIKTSQFFDGKFDIKGDRFFNEQIRKSVEELLPVQKTNWRTRGYADFYPGWDVWWNSSSWTLIDGLEYRTVKEKEYEVSLWYGKDWRKPILKHYNSQSDNGAVDG